MRWWMVVLAFMLIATPALAATIRLHFTPTLFQNQTLQDLTNNYSYYADNLTAPKYVVDGFKLRAEDFMYAGSGFYRTYNQSEGGDITVFELRPFVDSQVNERTKALNELVAQKDIQIEVEKNNTKEAERNSIPAVGNAIMLLVEAGIALFGISLLLVFLARNRENNSPNQFINTAYDAQPSYEDEISTAFNRIDAEGGFNYD